VALKGRKKFNNLVNEVNREAILQKKDKEPPATKIVSSRGM
jgi:hypothetical protein